MSYSQTIGAVVVQLLTIVLPMIGVNLGNTQLTGAVQTIIIVVAGIWIWVRRVQGGGVTAAGFRK